MSDQYAPSSLQPRVLQVAAAALPDRHDRVVVAADRLQRHHAVGRRGQPVPERPLVDAVVFLHCMSGSSAATVAAGVHRRVERKATNHRRRVLVEIVVGRCE